MRDLAEYEVHANGQMMAGASGPKEEAFAEAMHYARQYGDEGVVEIFEVTRINGRKRRELLLTQYSDPKVDWQKSILALVGGKGE